MIICSQHTFYFQVSLIIFIAVWFSCKIKGGGIWQWKRFMDSLELNSLVLLNSVMWLTLYAYNLFMLTIHWVRKNQVMLRGDNILLRTHIPIMEANQFGCKERFRAGAWLSNNHKHFLVLLQVCDKVDMCKIS